VNACVLPERAAGKRARETLMVNATRGSRGDRRVYFERFTDAALAAPGVTTPASFGFFRHETGKQ